MPADTPHELSHLLALVTAALAEAERLGARAGGSAATLAAAADEIRAVLGREGRPDEGLTPAELTTGNDR